MSTRMVPRLGLFLLLTLLLALTSASAGSVSLAWDPSAGATGYRVHYGKVSGQYTGSVDVGNTTTATVDALEDCTTWFFEVKAYNQAGDSPFSGEVSGWPRPVVVGAGPSAAERGRQLDVTVRGSNFQNGATIRFADPDILVNSISVQSCAEASVNVTVGATAVVGPTDVLATNPDGIEGRGAGLFTVEPAVAPAVTSTTPSDGQTGVSPAVLPAVRFSEPMTATSISAATVRLLDDAGNPVGQATGSPALSGDATTATVTPAAALQEGGTYRLQVIGGSAGVRDLANLPMSVDFNQTNGFTTAPDSLPPVISGILSAEVTGTSALITWNTDEPSNSQVFYREVGASLYQESPLDPGMVTSHAVRLQGLEPGVGHEYHVRSADAAGNFSTSSPDRVFTTLDSPFTYIFFEAESGVLVNPIRATPGAGAFGGGWIDTVEGLAGPGTPDSPLGTAGFGVHIPAAGTWFVWTRMYAPDLQATSLFVSVDGGVREPVFASEAGTWLWTPSGSHLLGEGLHDLEIGGRDPGVRADRILLTDDPDFLPTEQPGADIVPPQGVIQFTVTSTSGSNELSWQNPADQDLAVTVIRYRTDGRHPVSPADGFPVVEKGPAPGSLLDSHIHGGLTNGVTYHYSAFAVDAAGNVAAPARAEGTPLGIVPPGRVLNLRRTDKR